jgi:TIR domain/Sulfatase-modifying factor enzyme 1
VQEAVGTRNVETKTRVFVSYSRKDMAFADRLEVALKARGFAVLIDRQEIYAFEDWWKRIEALIGGADPVVFVLSPDAVRSDVALKELTHATSLNKRFAPIVCRLVEDVAVPEALRRQNFIFFDDPAQFEASADLLAQALQTDIAWIRRHTEFGDIAHRWVEAGQPGGMLLHPPVLDQAEAWLSFRPSGAPSPTMETVAFIAQSRKSEVAARRRTRMLNATLYTMLVGIILGLVGWINQAKIADGWRFLTVTWPYERANVRPHVLTAAQETALKPGSSFWECASDQARDYCPELIVVPTGSFMMGAPPTEKNRYENEGPQHTVTIAEPFAVARVEVTFDEWDTCVAYGDCTPGVTDSGWGRGQQPVKRHLGRRPALRSVAVEDHRQALSVAQRGAIRICRARRNSDALSLG